jgi:hypothetical protein
VTARFSEPNQCHGVHLGIYWEGDRRPLHRPACKQLDILNVSTPLRRCASASVGFLLLIDLQILSPNWNASVYNMTKMIRTCIKLPWVDYPVQPEHSSPPDTGKAS